MDRSAFYDKMREEFGSLSQSQVDGTNALLDEGEKRTLPMNQLSYILSTSWHETAATMMPIAEYGKGEGYPYGEPCPQYNNQVAYGRGYVQLTWDYNYEKADSELDLSGALLEDFNLALDPVVASAIIFTGMGQGWFTGKKLTDYVNDVATDYYNARKVVNGLDKAELLTNYAEGFEQSLRAAGYHLIEEPVEPPVEPVEPPITPEPEPEYSGPMYEYKTEMIRFEKGYLNTRGSEGWQLKHIYREKWAVWERLRER